GEFDWTKKCAIKVHRHGEILYEIKRSLGSYPTTQYVPLQSVSDVDGSITEQGGGEVTFNNTSYDLSINFNIKLLIDLIYSKSLCLSSGIDNLERDFLLYNIYIDDEQIKKQKIGVFILEAQEKVFQNYV